MKIGSWVKLSLLSSAALCGCGGGSPGSGSSGNAGIAGDSSGSVGASGSSSTGSRSTGSSGSGSSGGGSASSGGSGGTSPASSSGAGSISGSADASSGVAPADAAPQNDPETDYTQTKTIEMAPFDVPPNSEVFYCQTFANPWGKQVDIKTYDLSMDKGSHHMFAFYQPNATDAATSSPCPSGGLTFGAFTFTSQSPIAVLTFPSTVGATITQGSGFNMMAHYLNTTTGALTAHVKLTMYIAKDGAVTNHAGIIFLNNVGLTVPATGQPVVSSDSQTINQDVKIMLASSHMHKFATNFVSTATPPGGTEQTLYTTTQWDEPKPTMFATPLSFPSGTTFNWSCTDVNTTGQELTFGEYAQTNVMCIAVDIFYPVQDISNPVLGSAIGGL
jgi:hypothetical protein